MTAISSRRQIAASEVGRADSPRHSAAHTRERHIAGLVGATTAFTGVVIASMPFVWLNEPETALTVTGWNKVIVGLALVIVGITSLARLRGSAAASLGGCILGGWLTLSPLILDYGFGAGSTSATIADLLAGATILLVTILGYAENASLSVEGGAGDHD